MDESVAFEDIYNEISCMIVALNTDKLDIVHDAGVFISEVLVDTDRWDVLSSGVVSFLFCNWLSFLYEKDIDVLNSISIESMDNYQPLKGCRVFNIVSGNIDRSIIWQ